jgi:hypothetical protein
MVEMKIDASELKGEESKLLDKLSEFLKEKTGGETATEGKNVTVKGEGPALAKKYVKLNVKKFLHKHELDAFKVISDGENKLKIKECAIEEED